jgi:hypothetical protein
MGGMSSGMSSRTPEQAAGSAAQGDGRLDVARGSREPCVWPLSAMEVKAILSPTAAATTATTTGQIPGATRGPRSIAAVRPSRQAVSYAREHPHHVGAGYRSAKTATPSIRGARQDVAPGTG